MIFNLVNFSNQLKNVGVYWKYLTPNFELYLDNYLKTFENYRSLIKIVPTTEKDWKLLPYGKFSKDSSWKWRRQSLEIINKNIEGKIFDCTLEIGSWNGWLTKTLAKKSKNVIATDYFVCPFDGIGNISLLEKNITAIQCNIDTIKTDFKPNSFDLIVLNHNLSYMNNPVAYINDLIPLLKSNGIIISLGNTFFKNPENKIKKNLFFANQFYNKYHLNLYIQPVKGYMDFNDMKLLKVSGFQIKKYKSKFWQNCYTKFYPKAPLYTYITYKNDIQ